MQNKAPDAAGDDILPVICMGSGWRGVSHSQRTNDPKEYRGDQGCYHNSQGHRKVFPFPLPTGHIKMNKLPCHCKFSFLKTGATTQTQAVSHVNDTFGKPQHRVLWGSLMKQDRLLSLSYLEPRGRIRRERS